MSDFWDEMRNAFVAESSLDDHLQGKPLEGDFYTSVRNLTEKERKAQALKVPVEAGTRVSFIANLGSVLTYPDIPGEGIEGTVVTVRSANGDVTYDNGRVFVMWDDGKFRPIMAEHLRRAKSNRKQANAYRIVTSDLDSLAAFFAPAMGVIGVEASDDLVHKATKDLWSFKQDGDSFVIERLFTEDGNPLKV
jgi:hypothetical protein